MDETLGGEWLNKNSEEATRYTVYRTEFGIIIASKRMPPAYDISALAKTYAYDGYRYVSHKIPKELGIIGIAFVKNISAEDDWLEEIQRGTDEKKKTRSKRSV